MNYGSLYENKKRGTFDFPIELYCVDSASPRYQMPFHWHLEYELILVKSGIFELSLDGSVFAMNSGDCAWIGTGVLHGGTPEDCIYECVVFDLASRLLSAMRQEQKGYEWTTLGLMWQLMGSLINSRPPSSSPSRDRQRLLRLKSVLSHIRDHYQNTMSLEELAAIAQMSPKYFCRAFSQMTGRTPVEYLNYYRIEQAGEQLVMTENSVTEIALNCGFHDMSYFSKTFTRYKGVSPRTYRKEGARAPS